MDLTNLSLPELRELLDKAKAEIVNRERHEIEVARAQILEIARNVGVPVQQLIDAKAAKNGGLKGSKVAVQYRDPANATNEWSGRGRQPKWVKEWLDSGKSLDQLRVAA